MSAASQRGGTTTMRQASVRPAGSACLAVRSATLVLAACSPSCGSVPPTGRGATALFAGADAGHAVSVALTVLIVDDHAGFRRAARALLEAEGYEVVGESATGGEALEAADRTRPTLVLLDIGLPDLDGIHVAAQLTAADRSRAVVLTSSRDAADYEPLLERSGARGFIGKAELSGASIAALAA
jgi:CheY-like chemotaxis protein